MTSSDEKSPLNTEETDKEYNNKIRRYKFTENEDNLLKDLVEKFGTIDWNTISSIMKGRTARQCRDRWNHYLAPSTNTKDWSEEEDNRLIQQLKQVGKQWTYLASLFPGRTSISVRNRSCKLSRRINADPTIKFLLKDEYKKKKLINNNKSTILIENKKLILPPCEILLQIASVCNLNK